MNPLNAPKFSRGSMKLVADYSSSPSSEDESSDSETSSTDNETESDSDVSTMSNEETNAKELCDLPKIEELNISISSEQCQAVGSVKFIVDNQVIIEPRAGLAALDIGTVIFLDEGKKALGRVEEAFGPVTEPLYIVLLGSGSHFTAQSISVGTPVYYAPSTEHTSFVFLPDLLRMKGSDASWKFNQELPPDLQDDSEDDISEEQKYAGCQTGSEVKDWKKRPRAVMNMSRPRRVPNWMPPIRPPLMHNGYSHPRHSVPLHHFNSAIPPPPSRPQQQQFFEMGPSHYSGPPAFSCTGPVPYYPGMELLNYCGPPSAPGIRPPPYVGPYRGVPSFVSQNFMTPPPIHTMSAMSLPPPPPPFHSGSQPQLTPGSSRHDPTMWQN